MTHQAVSNPISLGSSSRRTLFIMSFPPKTDPDRVLTAAVKIVEEQGWAALSMRELGKHLGVRASSLYHHFRDRQAIEEALGRRATSELLLQLQVAAGRKRGKARVIALAEAYLAFARDNAALYHLVAGAPSSVPDTELLWLLLREAAGDLAGAVALWSFLHGFVTLEASGKFGKGAPQGALEEGLRALLAGIEKKGNIL
jgi:AcrR family transcriptional regulator